MSHHFFNSRNAGFTLVEALVSIAIIVVIISVITFNQSRYTDTASLNNLADEMTLSLSQAQVYSLSVKELSTGSGVFNASYGLMFQPASTDAAYFRFADATPKNGYYDGPWSCPIGSGSECLEKVAITRGNQITGICAIRENGTEQCSIGRVDITFTRPETAANFIYWNNGASGTLVVQNSVGAKITLTSPNGVTRLVKVYNTGQFSVQ